MADINKLISIKEELDTYNAVLVAVSKTRKAEEILEVVEAGHMDFGENYVQELIEKQSSINKKLNWHFIGHLQSNKAKSILPFINLIHGIDSFKLLNEISKHAEKAGITIDCLLQIFIAEEESKYGLSESEAETILRHTFNGIRIKGFMGMATNTENGGLIRKEFTSLYKFFENNRKEYGLSILSMGMTSDYKIALECGSNMVRIGSAIFGELSK